MQVEILAVPGFVCVGHYDGKSFLFREAKFRDVSVLCCEEFRGLGKPTTLCVQIHCESCFNMCKQIFGSLLEELGIERRIGILQPNSPTRKVRVVTMVSKRTVKRRFEQTLHLIG